MKILFGELIGVFESQSGYTSYGGPCYRRGNVKEITSFQFMGKIVMVF